MMAEAGEGTNDEIQRLDGSQPYVSCIRIFGKPILPPLMTVERRDEMRHYKGLAELVETKLKKKKSITQGSLSSRITAGIIAPKATPASSVEPSPSIGSAARAIVPSFSTSSAAEVIAPKTTPALSVETGLSTGSVAKDIAPSVSTDSVAEDIALETTPALSVETGLSPGSVAKDVAPSLSTGSVAEDIAPKITPALNVETGLTTGSAVEDTASKITSALSVIAKEPSLPNETNTSSKCVDTQEILEEFDPFAPSSCSTENSRTNCRQSASTDEFSKTGSSDDSGALTNSTDLYHYMDITGSSVGDGRSTRRSLTPAPGGDWNPSPSKSSVDPDIRATYEGLNKYLDSILISSASPPCRIKRSDEEATPTNGHLCDSFLFMCLDDDKRPKSCPLSPIPHEPARNPACDKLLDIVGEPVDSSENEKPRLVRSNSYTLDAPSPMLLAHLEAEKKKNDSVKTYAKERVVASKTKVSVVKRAAGLAIKRNDSHLSASRITHSPPKKAKNPTPAVAPSPVKSPTKTKELIRQPEVRKLFAELQAEHNRQMEELLRRQRKEQELMREAVLGRRIPTDGPHTWAQYLQTNGVETEAKQDVLSLPNPVASLSHPRKCLSSSFILSQITSTDDRNMSLSAPPGGLVSCLTERPSSSPALTTAPVARDTNGNLTNNNITIPHEDSAFISQILAFSESKSESASVDIERVSVSESSPRAKRRVWTNRQAESLDPDWLQLSRQRQMHWAASKIQAGIRGYLTRRLLRTERVQNCITVIHDTILCALELQKECTGNIEPSDLQLHGRLIHQLSDACREIHSIFVEFPVSKRMAIISVDRERLQTRSPRNSGPRPLSRATQIAITRKMTQNNSNSAKTVVSTARRKNWANNIKSKVTTQDSCEIVPTCLSRSSNISNSDTQRTGSGGGTRKPWR